MNKYFKKIALLCFSYLPSPAKILFYRMMGAKIGSNVYIGLGSYIMPYYSKFSSINLGDNSVIGDNVVVCGQRITMGKKTELKESARITGERSFTIGDYSYVGEKTIINLRRDVTIGEEVGIGSNSALYTHGLWLPAIDGYPSTFGKITIKNRAWIAAGVFIMPGITVGENAVISSWSIVTKDVPENTVYAGNPAKELKKFNPGIAIDPNEKNRIMKEIIAEFIERFEDRVSIKENTENSTKFIISFKKRVLGIFERNEDTIIVYQKEIESLDGLIKKEEVKNEVLLISLSFKGSSEEALEKGSFSWVDIGKRTAKMNYNTATSLMMKSFINNGLKFSSLRDKQ